MSTRDDAVMLLSEQLDATAAAHPDRLALVHGGTRLTWREVRDEADHLAKAMLGAGVGRGDHIGVWLPNHPHWLLLWLAALRIGAAVVPVNTRYRPGEAEYVLRKSEARILFVERSFLDTDYVDAVRGIRPGLPHLREVVVLDGEPGENTPFAAFRAGADDVPDADLTRAAALVEPGDVVIVVFTSGTTGFPKGVLHTHDALRMMTAVTAWFELGPADRVLGHLPLFHVAGVFSSFTLALVSGGALVQMDRWDAGEALELIGREGVTVLSGIPTHFIDLLRHPGLAGHDTATLRTGWIGGSTIPPEVIAGARDVLGMDALLPVYGMTETTSCTTLGRRTDPVESLLRGRGVPLGGYDVAVVDPQTRLPRPAGVEGEIAVRGHTVMKGYYKDPEATAAVTDAQGWFYTGDLGVFDDDGYLEVTGRRSDLFIVGGNNVHPAAVERVLLEHPAIAQAHVVPRPDDRLGEVAVAFVEVEAGATLRPDDVIAHCAARLASFKTPRDVVLVEDWPLTPTGKVERVRLRERARALAPHSPDAPHLPADPHVPTRG